MIKDLWEMPEITYKKILGPSFPKREVRIYLIKLIVLSQKLKPQ